MTKKCPKCKSKMKLVYEKNLLEWGHYSDISLGPHTQYKCTKCEYETEWKKSKLRCPECLSLKYNITKRFSVLGTTDYGCQGHITRTTRTCEKCNYVDEDMTW